MVTVEVCLDGAHHNGDPKALYVPASKVSQML